MAKRAFDGKLRESFHLRYSLLAMVDIHCHILPGLDDGSDCLDTSLKMAEMAVADGITHVIATPHSNSRFTFDFAAVRARAEELQSHLGERLILATGCDFHLSYENLEAVRKDPSQFTLNQQNYLLVEFADFSIPASLDQVLHELRLKGLHPVITHPERNPLIRADSQRLWNWMRLGCLVQVTAQSLTGRFGPPAQQSAENWLDADAVHFIASDAHNLTGRPLRLQEAFDVVAARRGADVARALFQDNPLAAFEGRALPYLPEPAEREKLRGHADVRRRKRFRFF
jgi:protein-tyrosine phosphatase